LAGTARKTLSTRAALHARTRTEMAREARWFWLNAPNALPWCGWSI